MFDWLAALGVEEEEMRRVFNLGIGFAAVVAAESTDVAARGPRAGRLTPGFVAGR